MELCHRFNEASSEFLVCFSCLDPKNPFYSLGIEKLVRFGSLYDQYFLVIERVMFREQPETYISNARRHVAFSACENIASLSTKMVEIEKLLCFP
jgi:hypothetical protein